MEDAVVVGMTLVRRSLVRPSWGTDDERLAWWSWPIGWRTIPAGRCRTR